MSDLTTRHTYITRDLVDEHVVEAVPVPRGPTQPFEMPAPADEGQVDVFARYESVLAERFGADPRFRRGPGIGRSMVWFHEIPNTALQFVPTPTALLDRDHGLAQLRSVFVRHIQDVVRLHRRVEYEVMLPLMMFLRPTLNALEDDTIVDGFRVAWDMFMHNWDTGRFAEKIGRLSKAIERMSASDVFADKLASFRERVADLDDGPEIPDLMRFSRILDSQVWSMLESFSGLREIVARADSVTSVPRDDHDRALIKSVDELTKIRVISQKVSRQIRGWYAVHMELASWGHRLELSTWMEALERQVIDPAHARIEDDPSAIDHADLMRKLDLAEQQSKVFRDRWSLEFESIRALVPEDIQGTVTNMSHYLKGLIGIPLGYVSMLKNATEKIARGGNDLASGVRLFTISARNWKQVRTNFLGSVNEKSAFAEIDRIFGTLNFGDVQVAVDGREHVPEHLNDGVLFMILFHLVSNAVDYKRADVPLRVRVEAKRRGDIAEIRVSDNGRGMQRGRVEEIMTGARVKSDRAGGTGRGMATIINQLMPRLVQDNSDAVGLDIVSTPGVGSAFTLRIPAVLTSAVMTPRAMR